MNHLMYVSEKDDVNIYSFYLLEINLWPLYILTSYVVIIDN